MTRRTERRVLTEWFGTLGVALAIAGSAPAAEVPMLVQVADGLGPAPYVFISPLGENVALTSFGLEATEPLALDGVTVSYTGGGAMPAVSLYDDGSGMHTITLNPPPEPGEWLMLDLAVTGTSGRSDRLTLWVAHQPLDINQDGQTNIRDATAFGDEFRGRKDPRLIDLNGDGVVNVRDATAFGSNWHGTDPITRPWRNLTLSDRPTPVGFTDANVARGGALYDSFWAVIGAAEPATNHPLWASRPDTTSNVRTGTDTWRCKECHGWDYKGVEGAYGTGSHRTGIAGIFGTTKTPMDVFNAIKFDHAYGQAGLSNADLWDLTKFVLEGLIDTSTIIDATGNFTGNTTTGQTLYDGGVGTNISCAACHGADGLMPPPGHPEFDEYPGLLASENPWEFQHKVRFGQPGTMMPGSAAGGGTTQDVADLGAYAQTLPQGPPPLALNIEMASPGHWHVTRAKTLNFTVTDDNGAPVVGLSPQVTVRTLAGTENTLPATDNGDGTYSVEYTARDIGGAYAMAYTISFRAELSGETYFDAWPAEVVRDGNERILPTLNGTLYAYQVRYGWDPGIAHSSDQESISLYFEPRRAIQEGDELNTTQPWRNSFNHMPDLTPTVLIESVDGRVSETLATTYMGLGIYRVQRIFAADEVGAQTEYTASFLFTDPYNGFAIDPAESAYPLVVSAPVVEGPPQPAPAGLQIDLASPGHWHVTRAKTLNFTVTRADGAPVVGLSPTVTVKTLAGTHDTISATDNGDGTYSAEYTAQDIGGGYSMAYAISFRTEHDGETYYDAWPAEVVRDGNERILPVVDGTLYAYQVRYGWDPGTAHASDEDPISLYFEPRRSIQEGDEINTTQPWRNSFNHLPDLTPTVLIESADGRVSETLTSTYMGLGIYRTQRVFSEAEVDAWREYTVSFLFTDPYNGFVIDPAETAYPLVVSAPGQDIEHDPETPQSILLAGKRLFESACAACHALPTAEDMKAFPTDEALVVFVAGMAEGSGLSEEDTDKVVRYALALRHDVPVGAAAALGFLQLVAIGWWASARRSRRRSDGRPVQ